MPVSCSNSASDSDLPWSESMYSGQFAKFRVPVAFASFQNAAQSTVSSAPAAAEPLDAAAGEQGSQRGGPAAGQQAASAHAGRRQPAQQVRTG